MVQIECVARWPLRCSHQAEHIAHDVESYGLFSESSPLDRGVRPRLLLRIATGRSPCQSGTGASRGERDRTGRRLGANQCLRRDAASGGRRQHLDGFRPGGLRQRCKCRGLQCHRRCTRLRQRARAACRCAFLLAFGRHRAVAGPAAVRRVDSAARGRQSRRFDRGHAGPDRFAVDRCPRAIPTQSR